MCVRCAICNRELTDPKSVDFGIGPICRARIEIEAKDDKERQVLLNLDEYPLDEAIVFFRKNGIVHTNLPRIVERHSPDGYEWGYGGSGPAEFALNIVEYYVRVLRNSDESFPVGDVISANEGVYHRATLALYQDFKWRFIATAPSEGGRIDANLIMSWIQTNTPRQTSMFSEAS